MKVEPWPVCQQCYCQGPRAEKSIINWTSLAGKLWLWWLSETYIMNGAYADKQEALLTNLNPHQSIPHRLALWCLYSKWLGHCRTKHVWGGIMSSKTVKKSKGPTQLPVTQCSWERYSNEGGLLSGNPLLNCLLSIIYTCSSWNNECKSILLETVRYYYSSGGQRPTRVKAERWKDTFKETHCCLRSLVFFIPAGVLFSPACQAQHSIKISFFTDCLGVVVPPPQMCGSCLSLKPRSSGMKWSI